MDSFNNMENWKASLPAVVGKVNAQDFENIVPYLRYYDSTSALAQLINTFKAAYVNNPSGVANEKAALKAELAKISKACEVVGKMKESANVSDTLFYADLRPFVLKLQVMAQTTEFMVDALTSENLQGIDAVGFAKCWSAIEGIDKNDNHRFDILRGMGNEITLQVKTAEPAAQVLRPFLDWLLVEIDAKY
jgi:hypothetical protein